MKRLSQNLYIILACLVCGTLADVTSDNNGNSTSHAVTVLARQLMLQQLYIEERTRSEGDSGIKTVRLSHIGSRPYYSSTHINNQVASIHDHANNDRTIGMGELIAVLNGVEFRTRHNDYRLYMPSRTSTSYHEREDVPYPDVPPEVLQHTNIQDQVIEMREWFKAFKTQNTTHRDYTPYFKPVLCYLEGGWTTSTGSIEESFESDRHFLDAKSWLDLQDKIRFTSYSGKKSSDENFAYLPTTIIDIKDGLPVLAQWNYRIMCHPLERDLPTNRLRVVDDLSARMKKGKNIHEHSSSKAARFQVNPDDANIWKNKKSFYQLLDDLMGEVPGKDNYQANIIDDVMGSTVYHYQSDMDLNEPLNVGFYHRAFKVQGKDAMGVNTRRRGFNDQSVFMAATTNPEIAPMYTEECTGRRRNKVCVDVAQRWTYAIPLEIIYMTPLSSWNPYHLTYKGDAKSDLGKTVTANGRNGQALYNKAYDGINSKIFYQTPKEFFDDEEVEQDPADTTRGTVAVLDPAGNARLVRASGHRILLPDIPGVGIIRQRYPIMPIHAEGSSIWKELEALKDIVLEPSRYTHMFRGDYDGSVSSSGLTVKLDMSNPNRGGMHEHTIELTGEDLELLYSGESLAKVTSTSNSHAHQVEIVYQKRQGVHRFRMVTCDSRTRCSDGHPKNLIVDNRVPTST